MADQQRKHRCPWVDLSNPLMVRYHDREWGKPVHDERLHFELLSLEGAQAGLSWATVLKKREHYRKLFKNFEPEQVARIQDRSLEQFLGDPGIIRNRLKVYSVRENAKRFLAVQEEFGSFDRYIWNFVEGVPLRNKPRTLADYPARTPLSDRISIDLKKRGFTFVGSTIIYAYLQAAGLVNDHSIDCEFAGKIVEKKTKGTNRKRESAKRKKR